MSFKKDITGQRFGRLTALKFMYTKRRMSMWLCQCSCGNEKIVGVSYLLKGSTRSCGCLAKEHSRNAMLAISKTRVYPRKDMTGQRFGRLVAIEKSGVNKQNFPVWKCVCDCGNTTYVSQYSLSSLSTKSCGCLTRKLNYLRFTKVKHGLYTRDKRLHHSWANMMRRCYCEHTDQYKDYGGRGIEVCYEWRTDPANFEKWALANGYAESLTLDRVDNNGNYTQENCRWVSRQEQNKNRRTTIHVTYKGETMCVKDLAIKYDKWPATIARRLKRGWSIERAVETTSKKPSEYKVQK